MKEINALLVNYDAEALELYGSLLSEYGIKAHAAATMPEALNMLLAGGYSGVAINADGFEYLPLLKAMRALTPAPIGISTSHYDEEEHAASIQNGANLYRLRHDSKEYRVKNFSDMVKIHLAFEAFNKKPTGAISCGNIRLHPETRRAFVDNREVKLSQREYDLLHYLIINHGIVVSHEQILINVWGDNYADADNNALWCQVRRLREKLGPDSKGYIQTVRGIGYSFDSA